MAGKGSWMRVSDGLTIPVEDTHEKTVKDDPKFFGVYGRPANLLRAAMEAGWMRLRKYTGEVVFEHALDQSGAAIYQIVSYLYKAKMSPNTRVLVQSIKKPSDGFTCNVSDMMDAEKLTKILGEDKLAVQTMLVLARLKSKK